MLSGHDTPDIIKEAMEKGVFDYVVKDDNAMKSITNRTIDNTNSNAPALCWSLIVASKLVQLNVVDNIPYLALFNTNKSCKTGILMKHINTTKPNFLHKTHLVRQTSRGVFFINIIKDFFAVIDSANRF